MVVSKKISTFASSNKNKQQFKTITIMKTYITKFLGNGKEEFVAKFNSYKEARQFLNSLWLKYNTAGIKVLFCGRDYIDIPSMGIGYNIEGKANMATKRCKDYWNNH